MSSPPRAFSLVVSVCLPALAACVNVSVTADPPTVLQIAAPPEPPDQPIRIVARDDAPLQPSHLWHFGGEFGTAVFDAAGGAHGKMGPGVDLVPGCAGEAVALEGNARSAVILGQTAGQFGRRDFTVSLWFRTTTTNRNNELLSNRADGSHGNFFNLRFASGKVVYEIDEDTSGKNYVALESRPGLNDGAWHHVAARRRGTRATLFIDGQRAADGSTGGVTDIDNGHSLEIGSSSVAATYGLHFQGTVDEVAIFDHALGDEDVESIAAGSMGCRLGAAPRWDGHRRGP